MKIDTMKKVAICGIVLSVVIWVGSTFLISKYLVSDTFKKDITQAGITIKSIINDIKEAE